MRRSAIVWFAIILSACSALCQYFPKASLGNNDDTFKREWYSSGLRALQEPSLFARAKDPAAESYRFLWLRSFHAPVAVRLDRKPDGTSLLTTKVASGAGGYNPGHLTGNTSRLLTKEQTQGFLDRLNALDFWALPNPIHDRGGCDGAQWIVEGVNAGRYHVVDRWSPTNGPVFELGKLFLFDMAGMSIPKNQLY